MRLGKTAVYHFGTQIVISLSGFIATFVIGVLGGASDLGYYSYAVGLGFFWLVIPADGVSQALKKRMSEGDEPAAYFGGGALINAALALSFGALVLVLGAALRTTDAPNLVLVQVLTRYDVAVATLLVAATFMKTTLAGLEGQKFVARSGSLKAVDRVFRTTIQVLVVVLGFGVAALTFGHAVSLVAVAALGVAVSGTRPARPGWVHVRSLWDYAKYAWVGALRGRVYGWMDTIVLGMFLTGAAGATLLGVYEVAWGIGSLLATASSSISATLFPEMSDLSSNGDRERVIHYLDEALAFSGVIVVPGFVGAALVGERILLFYRPEYAVGTTVLVILVGAYLLDVYASQFLNVLNAVDRPDVAMRVNVAFVLANVVLNVVLIWWIGWTGAAVATAASAGVRATGGYVALAGLLHDVSVPVRTLGAQAISAGLMGIVLVSVEPVVPHGRVWTLALVLGGASVYFGILLAVSVRVRSKTRSLLPARVRVV
ncbi:lipopolysaccharide biosynthesis protein [Halobacteria archaeon HArc-gm2]|nr:lipopolysaccharide biosynthesis protein [Halobacteria archaeon HArc-gm2]